MDSKIRWYEYTKTEWYPPTDTLTLNITFNMFEPVEFQPVLPRIGNANPTGKNFLDTIKTNCYALIVAFTMKQIYNKGIPR